MEPTGTDPGAASRQRVASRLARMGFTEAETVAEALTAPHLNLWDIDQNQPVDAASAAVLSALSRAAEPDLAATTLRRLADTAKGEQIITLLRESSEFRARLIPMLGASMELGDHVVLNPDDALQLQGPKAGLPTVAGAAGRIAAAVGADAADPMTGTAGTPATVSTADAAIALRRAYRRELVLVAAQDLAGEMDIREVTEALSDLAGYLLSAGLAVARTALPETATPCRLSVIAMGKCGARELNYVSDVDVIFVAEAGEAAAGGTSAVSTSGQDALVIDEQRALATATKLAAEMMRVCSQAAWEVDAALRPEGKAGPLVRTLASHEAYYRRWASTWEFQALLKARPIAGDPDLGKRYVEALAPLVWTAAERPDFVGDVQAMRRRVIEHIPSDLVDRELKLGPGGLRDVEFAVQLLQMVHGRADESLRVQATLLALSALRDGGFVGRDDADSLSAAYAFLRTAEHRLQLWKLRRTHLVPDDKPGLNRLARSLGFRPDARGDAVAVWNHEWALHAREVRRLHEKLFYRPLLEAVARVPSEGLRLTPDEAKRRLTALGYLDPAGALRHLEALTSGLSRRAAIQRALLPVILSELASAPDPDAGLLAYRQVSDSLGSTPWFLRLLRDEGAVPSRLAHVLGTSRYVANLLVRAPDALQMLGDLTALVPRRIGELESMMSIAARRQDTPEQAAHAVRSLRRVELLRIAFAQLLDLIDDHEVRRGLTELADATLSASLGAAMRFVQRESGGVLGIRFALIAMGRLGGQELSYGSDADVIFVFSADEGVSESDATARATAIAETLRAMLASPSTDPPLLLDANLRPEGRSGPLVRSLSSYAEYYQRWSSVWEAQALLRARFCAGDPELGEQFMNLIDSVRYPEGGLAAADVIEIRRIKSRVDSERLPRGADPHTHTKLGRGGLADIEWTAQLLQLRHAHAIPGLRTPMTLSALFAARDAGLITPDDEAALEAAWRLASRVRDAVMLVRDKAEDQIPKPGRVLTGVGLVLGYQPGFDTGQLLDDYRRATRRARRVVEAVFYDSPT